MLGLIIAELEGACLLVVLVLARGLLLDDKLAESWVGC